MPDHSPSTDERASLAQPSQSSSSLECTSHLDFSLERMDGLIPWQNLEDRIRPFYLKAGRGRHPYPLSAMLRVHCVPTKMCGATEQTKAGHHDVELEPVPQLRNVVLM